MDQSLRFLNLTVKKSFDNFERFFWDFCSLFRVMENNSIESYHQAQKAQLFTNDRHPGTAIQLGLTPTHHPAVQGVNETALLRSYPASAAGKTFTGLNYYTIPESEKLTKMRQRKQVKTNRKEKKNVKAVTTTQGDLEEYNIDNVLQELGEVIITTLFTFITVQRISRLLFSSPFLCSTCFTTYTGCPNKFWILLFFGKKSWTPLHSGNDNKFHEFFKKGRCQI